MSDTTLPVAGRPDPERVRGMFAALAPTYDRANTILSAGIDRLWRAKAVRAAELAPGMRVLDCATGTGSLAFRLARAGKGAVAVTGSDFCEPMLAEARVAARKKRGPEASVRFESADVMALPYPDQTFDRVTIAFGIRNVADPVRGLRELRRVLRPGGRLVVLEFGRPVGLGKALQAPLRAWLPLAGNWITGNGGAYAYLDASSDSFPSGPAFEALLREAGFSSASSRALFPGIAFLSIARR